MKDERPIGKDGDSTVEQLLQHLQEMRSAVPVNLELKEALKQQLLAKEQQNAPPDKAAEQDDAVPPVRKTAVRRWLAASWVTTGLLLAALIASGVLLLK
jgi:hypothetical protein